MGDTVVTGEGVGVIFLNKVAKVTLPLDTVHTLRQRLDSLIILIKQGYYENTIEAAAILGKLYTEGKRATRSTGSTRGRTIPGMSTYRHGKYGRDE
jgi:hypothetical protein